MIKSVISIGTFDGLHLGHQYLLKKLVSVSEKYGLRPVVITINEPVRKVTGVLTTPSERIDLLRTLPLEKIIILPNTPRLTNQPARQFFKKVLVDELNIKHFVVGRDFAFGKDREGNIGWLSKICLEYGVKLDIVSPVIKAGKAISSSGIRELLLKGDLDKANKLLGRFYQVNGKPMRERGVATELGFPTVNLHVQDNKILPMGVFFAIASVRSRDYPCVVNIGFRPTFFKGNIRAVEFHLLGFDGKWPTSETRIYLLKKHRDERAFRDIKKLKTQIEIDVKMANKFFNL